MSHVGFVTTTSRPLGQPVLLDDVDVVEVGDEFPAGLNSGIGPFDEVLDLVDASAVVENAFYKERVSGYGRFISVARNQLELVRGDSTLEIFAEAIPDNIRSAVVTSHYNEGPFVDRAPLGMTRLVLHHHG